MAQNELARVQELWVQSCDVQFEVDGELPEINGATASPTNAAIRREP